MAVVEVEKQRPYSLSLLSAKRRDELTPGEKLKIWHTLVMSPAEAQAEKDSIAIDVAKFWLDWTEFRCGVDEGAPRFDHVIRLLPVRKQFAEFCGAKPNSLFVDLGAGSANMAEALRERGVNHYVAIDSNPAVQEAAARRSAMLGLTPYIIQHDIFTGFPAELKDIIEEVKPDCMDYGSNWSYTYGSKNDMLTAAYSYLDPGNNQGLPATLSINMITDGKFSPKVLAVRFMTEITPKVLARGQVRNLIRAYRALPQMIKFGKVFTDVAPIWYPNEIKEMFEEAGFKVIAEDRTLLWGQSTAMKVCR